MTEKYYLLTIKYTTSCVGTIFRYDGLKLVDVHKNNDMKYNENILQYWIEIEKEEALYLVKKTVNFRIDYHERGIYYHIKELKVSDRCLYLNGRRKTKCTIISKIYKFDTLCYKIKTENGNEHVVHLEEIEVLDEISLKMPPATRVNVGVRDEDIPGSSEQGLHSANTIKEITTVMRCGSNNIDIVNPANILSLKEEDICNKLLSLKQGANSSIVKLRWRGRVNGITCLGCELSKDCKYGTNGRFKDQQLFECAEKRGVLILADVNMESCESGSKDAAFAGEKMHNKIEADVFILEKCICCAERVDKRGSGSGINIGDEIIVKDDCRGTIKWMGLINGERSLGLDVVSDDIMNDGTFNGMKIFECYSRKAALVTLHDISKTIWCEPVRMKVYNPTLIQSITPHRNLSKHLFYKEDEDQMVIEVKWLGLVDEILCYGCVLPADCPYGTAGKFKDNVCFECKEKRGVLIPMGEFRKDCAWTDKEHDQLKLSSSLSIVEESFCCVESTDKNVKIPTGVIIIVNIANKKHFVKCLWIGRINGKDCVGLEMNCSQNNGTNGTFCGLELFSCVEKRGLLFETQNILYEQCIIREIFLRKDYDLSSIPKEKDITEIGKQFQVKCTPTIFGIARFCMKLLGELFMCVDIGSDYLQKNYGPLDDVLYENNVINGSYVIIVKLNSVKIVTEKSANKRLGASNMNVNARRDSDKLQMGDIVRYEKSKHNICDAKVAGFKIENGVRYVGVIEMGDSCGIIEFVPENDVKKFVEVNVFAENGSSATSRSSNSNRSKKKTESDLHIGPAPVQSPNRQESKKKIEKTVENNSQKTENGYNKSFLESEFDMASLKKSCNEFVKGQVVRMINGPEIQGRALFNTMWSNELLLAVELDPQKCCETFEGRRLYDNGMGIPSVIIVRLEDTDIFCPKLSFLNGSDIINQDSIKWKWDYVGDKIKKGDIVSYGDNHRRVVKLEWLNKTKCVGVVDAIDFIGDSPVIYLQEWSVTKVPDIRPDTRFHGESIIDGRSIFAFMKSRNDAFSVDDEVEWQCNKKKLHGKVTMLGEANGLPSVIIESDDVSLSVEIRKCGINDVNVLKELCRENRTTFIVKASSVKKRESSVCRDNNVYVVEPSQVRTAVTRSEENKTITFKSNKKDVVAILKWVGDVNGELCIGCDMKNRSNFGTNGTFGGNQLFDCDPGKGVLIPVNKISDHCINKPHKALAYWGNGRIKGLSVCCAKRLDEFEDKRMFKLEDRLHNDKDNVFGICRWMGVINGVEAVGLEMIQCTKYDNDSCVARLALFPSPPEMGALFLSEGFTIDVTRLRYCSKNGVLIMDAKNITSLEYEEILKKKIIYNIGNKSAIMDVKWRGRVNGVACVGCELRSNCNCGTDGVFIKYKWFDCHAGRGALIPIKHLKESCLHSEKHAEIVQHNYSAVKQESVCCVEELRRLKSWPQIEVGSKLKYRPDHFGQYKIEDCEWIGLVNGRECIGTNLENCVDYKKNGNTFMFDLFKCHKDRGAIFLSEDIEHDIDGEKVHFVVDKFVDVTKIWKMKKSDASSVNGIKIGDYVSTFVDDGAEKRVFKGELKWIGVINKVDVVGLDLEDTLPYGMDGVIDGKCVFKCAIGHGVVTTIDNVQRVEGDLGLTFTVDGIVDANKYLKCKDGWNEGLMRERQVSRDGLVFVVIINDNVRRRKKGTLRWSGTMNGQSVAIVELSEYYENGTDGSFWRYRLVNCGENTAVAVSWDSIFKYTPYEETAVPIESRLFQQIDINSAVVIYIPINNVRKNFFGTVKWSGINEHGTYIYGIELDDRYSDGTDGKFIGQKLFHCQDKYGVLAEIGEVAPDIRFTQPVVADKDVPESKSSESAQYCIPVKSFYKENCGIQGNANSCYFDSTIFALFSKSDVLDFMISPRINENEDVDVTRLFRDVMSWEIVYPLREFGFVSFHKTQNMRDIIRNYGPKFEEMIKQETDMENVGKLLAKLSPNDQLLRLTTFVDPTRMFKNKCMFMQLFVILDRPLLYISSQQMLDISMAQNDIMFDETPTCLIMQAPRDARGINCYDNVLPSKMIEISKLCLHSHKKCSQCDAVAEIQCKKCVNTHLHVKEALFCSEHDCKHLDTVPIPDSTSNSRSEIQMQLKAIICIEKAHFVAYVKEDEFQSNWVFFDSMSTQDITNNFSVPSVTLDRTVTQFLNLDEATMRDQLAGSPPVALKRILKDSYIFVYHNSTKTCY